MQKIKLFITCEHGGNEIPAAYEYLFEGNHEVLNSHRGSDLGAWEIAKHLQHTVADFYHATTISRLFIELNRSIHHPKLWSEFTINLSQAEKEKILTAYYVEYRSYVEAAIKAEIEQGHTVVHIAIHSFTPVFEGNIRTAEIGLLYDPTRKPEKQFCLNWQQQLKSLAPQWRIRRNYPYQGISDGFPTYLRTQFAAKDYLGIELEMNQGLLAKESAKMKTVIAQSLAATRQF